MFVTDKSQALDKNHGAIGLCAAISILDKWGASAKQICSVLSISFSTYTRAENADGNTWSVNLDIDAIQRISFILNIAHCA